MKKLLFLLVVIATTTLTMAQSSQLATLSHAGTIRTFYGADALNKAHEAAENGDVITLSSGSFNGITITKAITLRGAGVGKDTINNIPPTIINSGFSIKVPANENAHFTMEGISTASYVQCVDVSNPMFLKCSFGAGLTITGTENITIMHCMTSGYASFDEATTGTIISSVFKGINYMYNITCSNSIIYELQVALYKNNSNSYSIQNTNFYNCIFIPTVYGSVSSDTYRALHSSNMAYNCVGRYMYKSGTEYDPFVNLPNHSSDKVIDIEEMAAMFTASEATYTKCESKLFQLSETGKGYKGNDGKEVGIYGGNMPFDLRTTTPQITKCNVAAKSTPDGKLSVDIEVSEIE